MVTIETKEPTEKEKRISELEKQATALSKTDLKKAIECLQEVKRLKPMVETSYPIKASLRLPKLLYRNGDEKEAIAELQFLIDTTADRAEKAFRHHNQSERMNELLCEAHRASELQLIYEEMSKLYDKMSLKVEKQANSIHKKISKERKSK